MDILHKSLTRHKFDVGALHGDMAQTVRFATLEKFKANELRLLVCSDVAARGLDIGGLSHVFNFDVPHHAEDYVHRIGRTGRAGLEGHAFTIATPDDRFAVEAIEKLTGHAIPPIIVEGLDPVDWAEDDGRKRARPRRRRGAAARVKPRAAPARARRGKSGATLGGVRGQRRVRGRCRKRRRALRVTRTAPHAEEPHGGHIECDETRPVRERAEPRSRADRAPSQQRRATPRASCATAAHGANIAIAARSAQSRSPDRSRDPLATAASRGGDGPRRGTARGASPVAIAIARPTITAPRCAASATDVPAFMLLASAPPRPAPQRRKETARHERRPPVAPEQKPLHRRSSGTTRCASTRNSPRTNARSATPPARICQDKLFPRVLMANRHETFRPRRS